ncbi:MAG: N utilization substance protein B-like protein [Parcubacteria group bacterium GW2011_GWB1_49_7]|nr:MAG: N utilization substance protein B-like protein [Parcubacteria group bacterium GW2011_GWB1_49_7]OHB06939.1 MAG: transcription antitermination factor NusB [Candidatus Zambryskibacteria bacterium RIFCSPLOWO2_01_FULL_48_25]
MSQRHLSRSIVLQTLFEWDFEKRSIEEIRTIFEKNITEFAPGSNDRPFMERLLNLVLDKQKDLDNLIAKAAPDWPLEKIAPVDRNILRIGLAELLFADRKEVPPKVAINEAIELAKQFGGETSGRFINGVLGAVYKEMGEPGKNDQPKPKKKFGNVPLDQLPVEKLAGAAVFARHEGEVYVALVHDVFGHWTLTKGRLNEGESDVECLRRKVPLELGVPIEVKENIGSNSYSTFHPEKGKMMKEINYYMAEAPFMELTLEKKEEKGGLDDVRWFKLADILDLNFYDDILPIVTKAITKLAEGK